MSSLNRSFLPLLSRCQPSLHTPHPPFCPTYCVPALTYRHYRFRLAVPLVLFTHQLWRTVPPPCEHYPYPYSLRSHWHQRTHLCEAIRSQHYTKSSRSTTLSRYCYGFEYSQHFLILCRFAAPLQVARRHSVDYLRTISISKNQRCILF